MQLSPEQLAALTDSVPALISFVDTQYRYRMCNRAYLDWFGLESSEIVGRTVQEVLGDSVWQVIRPRLAAAMGGQRVEFEHQADYRHGQGRFIHVVYVPHRNAAGQIEGIVAFVTDVTDKRAAETIMRQSEERFRAFVTTTSDVVYRMNADWSELKQLVGRDFIADTGDASRGWLQKYIHPDDHAAVLAAIRTAIAGKTMFHLEHRVIRIDGTLGWTASRAIPILDPDGRILEWLGTATDVTVRREADRTLRESEERYRSLFESIDEGFCVIEPLFNERNEPYDYLFHEVNPAFEKHTGMKGAMGRRMLEFVPSMENLWLHNYARVALTGEPIRFEAEHKTLGRWFDVYAFRVGPSASRRVAVLFNDISQRRVAEQALQESERRFRDMADDAPMLLWVTDPTGSCTYLSQRWYEFTGQTPATGLGYGWLEAVHPDDRPGAEQRFLEANRLRTNFRVEYRLRRQDGVYRWSIDAASPRFAKDGEYLGYIGSVIDIQDRREAEDAARHARDRFDIVKDVAQVGFWFCDLPFDTLEWDHRVKEHFWLPADAHVTIDLFYARLHPDDREPTRRAIDASISAKERYDIVYRTVDPTNGAVKWVRAIGRSFHDAQDRPIRFDGVTLDITQQKRDEENLRDAKEAAERAARAKDDFLAQLSHELRTPLAPVLMTAEALAEDAALPDYARQQLAMITRNVALEARLIDDLLDLTRITHGKLTLRVAPCNVEGVLELVAEMIGEDARAKGIRLTLDLAAQKSVVVGDSARLQQVFWNLLNNAVKFTPAGGHIRIHSANTASRGPHGAAMLRVEVSDDGIGFDPNDAEKLFEPFQRGSIGKDPRFPGLGLGLSIARSVIELHAGVIEARSAGPGHGSSFIVELPGVSARPPSPASDARPPIGAAKDPSLRLLLVEDHRPTLDALTRLLSVSGHQVTPAATASEAATLAESQAFDAVVTDLGLPDGNGIDLMKQLRARHGLQGIALSGYGMEDDLKRTAEAGFVAHLVKPVQLKDVLLALRRLPVR